MDMYKQQVYAQHHISSSLFTTHLISQSKDAVVEEVIQASKWLNHMK